MSTRFLNSSVHRFLPFPSNMMTCPMCARSIQNTPGRERNNFKSSEKNPCRQRSMMLSAPHSYSGCLLPSLIQCFVCACDGRANDPILRLLVKVPLLRRRTHAALLSYSRFSHHHRRKESARDRAPARGARERDETRVLAVVQVSRGGTEE